MRKFIPLLVVVLLVGCETLIPPKPETGREVLVTAELEYQAVLKTIDRMVDLGTLKGENANDAVDFLVGAKVALAALRGSVNEGVDYTHTLTVFNSAIFALIGYLEKEEANG